MSEKLPNILLTNERLAFRIAPNSGTYSLYDIRKNLFVIENASIGILPPGGNAAVTLFAGDDFELDGEPDRPDALSANVAYRHPKYPLDLLLEATLSKEDPSELSLRVGVRNRGARPMGIHAIYPLWIDPMRDGAIDLGGVWSHGAMYRTGLHSESDASIEHFSKPDGTEYDSYCFTLLHNLHSKSNLAIGYLTLKDQFAKVVACPSTDGMHITATCECDDCRLDAGATLWSETMWLRVTDEPYAQIERYLSLTAAANNARPCPLDATPMGWSSRHCRSEAVTDEEIVANLSWLLDHHDSLPIKYVLIDDGWQERIGDWDTARSDAFPSGLAPLAQKIKSVGCAAGIAFAPFVAEEGASVVIQHPDWIVHDKAGKHLVVADRNGKPCFALDSMNADAVAWVQENVHRFVDEWGFTYLKLDMLNCAVPDGAARADSHATRAQAYRRAIEAIREAAGEGAFLIGSGAPLGPSVGILDACRIGADIAQEWEILGHDSGVHFPGRNTLVRSIFNGRWFYNDTDAMMVRSSGADVHLTEDERETMETFIGMSGGMVSLGDDLETLTEDDLTAARFMMPPIPQSGKSPMPLGRHITPNVYTLAQDNHRVVAVFNWDELPCQVTVPFESLGLSKTVQHLVFDVKEQSLVAGHAMGEWITRLLPPHAVRVVNIVPVPNGRKPVLVGSSFHIGQGIAELKRYEWSPSAMEIDLSVPMWVGQSGALTFYAPEIASATVNDSLGATLTIEFNDTEFGRTMTLFIDDITSPDVRFILSSVMS